MKVILLGLALIIGMTNALSADEVAYLRTLIVTEFEEAALAEAAAGAVVIHANLVRQSKHSHLSRFPYVFFTFFHVFTRFFYVFSRFFSRISLLACCNLPQGGYIIW
jgi:hypothetical protein